LPAVSHVVPRRPRGEIGSFAVRAAQTPRRSVRPAADRFVADGRRGQGAGEHRKRAHLNVRERGAQPATRPSASRRDSR
jgi:hypothetical protein